MELLELKNEYRIAGLSLPLKGKTQCGDHIRFKEILSERLVVLSLSDGVGSLHHDCDASQIACDSFVDHFASLTIPNLRTHFEEALIYADKMVSDPLDIEKKGMMCTFIGVVWDMKNNLFLYCNIGDSRLYMHSIEGLKQLSTDEKKAVLMRDKSGKLLSQSGVLIVREGLTNAMGYDGAKINIIAGSIDFGDALILSSDGLYDIPCFSEEIIEVLQNSDIKKAIEKFSRKNSETFNDDASILILQRTILPDEIIDQLREALYRNRILSSLSLPVHLVSKWIMDESLILISRKDSLSLEKLTEYVIKNELKLSESFIEKSMKEMRNIEFYNSLFYNMLIAQLRMWKW